MKKTTLLLLMISNTFLYSRDTTKLNYSFKKNEIHFNLLYIAFKLPEFSYERLLNANTALGCSVFWGNDKDLGVGLGAFPYFRRYCFSKIAGTGLFGEINSAIYQTYSFENTTRFSLYDIGVGVGIGGKFNLNKIWTAEALVGVGRKIYNNSGGLTYPRFGISFGRRF